jgi:hypothetical protein
VILHETFKDLPISVLHNDLASTSQFENSNGLWLGYVATPKEGVLDCELYKKAKLLRGNVYVDELEWLPSSVLDNNGYEQDTHDDHSSHLVMVDTRTLGDTGPYVFANLRYISPRSSDDHLPFEVEFGIEIAHRSQSIEMSRFMSRHFDPGLQTLASIAMISHTVGLLVREDLIGYATLEIPLLRRIKSMGLSVVQLSPMMVLDSYGGTKNCAVQINGPESLTRAREIASSREDYPYYRYFDIATHGTNEDLVEEIFVKAVKPQLV